MIREGAPESTSRHAWYVAAMLSAAYLLSIMDRYLLSVVLEDVKRDLRLTDTQLGVLQGPSMVLLFLVASIPIGRLADIANRKLIVVAGLAVWTLCTLSAGLADNFIELMLTRLGVGLGEAALLPCAMSLIASYFSSDKLSRGIAIYSMGGTFGRAAAFAGGGAVLAWLAMRGGLDVPMIGTVRPWQGVFVTAGVLGLIFALIFLLTVREPARPARREGSNLRSGVLHFWRNRRAYFAICIPFSMVTAAAMQLASWSVSFYVRHYGISAASASAIVGITGLLFGPIGHLSGGWINDALRNRGVFGPQPLVLLACLGAATLCIAIFTVSPTVPVAALAYGIGYFALCVAGPTGFGGVQLPTPDEHRGFIGSVFLFLYTALGTGLGPLLVGLFVDHWFHSEGMLGQAMIATNLLLIAVSLPFAIFGRPAYVRAVQENEQRVRS